MTILAFGAPIAAYLWFLDHYGSNVFLWDQLDDVHVIERSYHHLFDWSSLWAQHNENRILFPNLIVLLLGHTTNFNVQVEEYIGAGLLVASVGLLIWAHKRRAPATPWLYYCPVALLLLSFVQYQNTLSGFQLGWYLVLFALAATIAVLDRIELTWTWLLVGIAAATMGSYSSLQGLLIWPVGALLLFQRRRPPSMQRAWIAASAIAIALYFSSYRGGVGGASAVSHPVTAVGFFLVATGDVIGVNVKTLDATGWLLLVLGLVLVASALFVLTRRLDRDPVTARPVSGSLIVFGLCFAGMITVGRISAGWSAATQSRYRTFDLLTLVGLYLAVIDERASLRTPRGSDLRPENEPDLTRAHSTDKTPSGSSIATRGWRALAAVVLTLVVVQLAIGTPEGLAGARIGRANQVTAARVLVNIRKYPDPLVQATLGEVYPVHFIRQMAQVAEVHHLSLFATGAAADYRAMGLLVDIGSPSTTISVPAPGAVVKGSVILSATATDAFGVTDVEFEVSGQGVTDLVVSRAQQYRYGWLGSWSTRTLPNGLYTVQSVAHNSAGRGTVSQGVSVTVEN